MIDFNQLLINLGGYIGSGFAGILVMIIFNLYKAHKDHNLGERTAKRDDFEVIKDTLFEQREIDAKVIFDMKREMEELRDRILLLESRSVQRPFPEWGLSFDGRYTWCNISMCKMLLEGKPQEWILGKTHSDIWPKEIVKLLESLDMKVRASTLHYAVSARIKIPGIATEFSVLVKWGLPDPMTGVITNYYGMLIPMD